MCTYSPGSLGVELVAVWVRGEGSRHIDLRGNIRWVSLTLNYSTDLVGEDSCEWAMAGYKKN